MKLPSVDEEKIERIITFEAQQNVPFPIEEVVWDYQLVGSGVAEEIEVVLVAIKSDLLEDLNAAVEATGLQTRLVDVATMALYNAFRFNYSELTGCSLVIDIGARIKRKYGEELTSEFVVNPALLGGLRVRVGSDVWDGTLRNRLERLKQQL